MSEVTVGHGGHRDGWIWISVNGVQQLIKAGDPTELDASEIEVLAHAGISYDVEASGNFTNIATNNAADGVYTLNGQTVALSDIIDLSSADSSFDPIANLDADGLLGAQITLVMKDPLRSTLLSDGFTVTFEITADSAEETGLSVRMYLVDETGDVNTNLTSSLSMFEGEVLSASTSVSALSSANEFGPVEDILVPGQINRIAMTFDDAHASYSLNGAATFTRLGAALDAALVEAGIVFGGGTTARLRSFAFYEVVADADLPTLSAL